MRNWFHIQGEEIVDVEAIAQTPAPKAEVVKAEEEPTRWENGKRVYAESNSESSAVRTGPELEGDRLDRRNVQPANEALVLDFYRLTLHGNEKIEIKREDLKLGGLAAKRNADWDKAVIKGDYLLKAYDIESDAHILRVYDGPTFKSLFRQSFN